MVKSTKKNIDSTNERYFLYLLECKGGSFYTGIAKNVEQRFAKHLSGKGAAYTRANPPVKVLATKEFSSKDDALRAEYAVKQKPKSKKIASFDM